MKHTIFVLCSLIGLGDAIFRELRYSIPSPINPLRLIYVNRCIEDYGCFYTGPPFFHLTTRPISLPPTKRVQSIKFQLFTPSNPDKEYQLESNPESLANSPFNPVLETKFLIHGFLLTLKDGKKIKNAMLKLGDYNVILVDWTAINGPPYAKAVANTRIVGAVTAKLIHFLMNTASISPKRFHVIGHSLGAHTAGYVGERVPNLGRITGLDPAGPYFQHAEAEVRLDPTDARFVDVIHTDGHEILLGGLGINDPVGHMDFYPNGGRLQPGCVYASKRKSFLGETLNFTTKFLKLICGHMRVNELFLESVNNTGCRFSSVLCSSYEDYEKGLCDPQMSTVAEMGFHSKRISRLQPPAKFYLRTNTKYPFCNQDSIHI